MTNDELAREINTTKQTLYHWRKSKPTLYKILMAYKNGDDNIETKLINDIIEHTKKLNEKEQEKLLLEIKLKLIQKELEKYN